MVCEKVLGKLSTFNVNGKTVDYVDIDWDDAFKKIHRKITAQGRDIGIRMDDSVLTHGLTEGDVLYADDQLIIAVHTPPCEMIRLTPYNEPMLHMLSHIHGVNPQKVVLTPDFEKRISSGGHGHHH